MSKTEIEQVPQAANANLNLEAQNTSNSAAKLQQAEVHREQTISELEERLVREAVSAMEETKQAITLRVAFGSQR
ncbi:MAG: hypothetical protein AAFY63_15870 [Cyanobacteria bacterium J06643_13]